VLILLNGQNLHLLFVCCLGEESGACCEVEMPTRTVDVSYFRDLIRTETERLTMLCAVWHNTMDDLTDVPDEG